MNQTYLALAVFALLIAAFYGNTLLNDFVHDDIGIIVNNPNVHSLSSIPKAFTTCFFEFVFGSCEETMQYRPIQSLSYILTWQISSSPWVFHLVNLAYFLIGAFLVFVFVRMLTQKFFVSFSSALIFVAHPINNEVVNWIAAVPELSYAVFALLSLIFYVKYRQDREQSRPMFRDKNLLLVFLFYALGMLSKEPAALLPVLFFVLDLTLFRMPGEGLRPKQFFRLKANPYIMLALLFFTFVIVKTIVLQGFLKSQPFYQFTMGERIYAFFELFAAYLLKLADPYPLLFFYPFGASSQLASLQFFAFVAVFALFGLGAYLFFKRRMNLHAFFLIWIFVFLFPVLAFLNSLGENIFAERYLFLPSVGFAFLLSSSIGYLAQYRNKLGKTAAVALILLLVAISWVIVYPRNKDWKDSETLFTKTLEKNPDAHPLRFDRAVEWGTRKGDFAAAKLEFEEIERRNPHWVYIHKVYNNIGDVYGMEGNKENAIAYYLKSFEASGNRNFAALNAIGVLYAKDQEYLKALPYFCRAVQINPQFGGGQGNFDRTISILQSQKDENPESIYEALLKGDSFQKSSQDRIVFTDSECSQDTCSLFFASKLQPGEIILPFLIHAVTPAKKPIALADTSFSPQTLTIKIDVSSKYQHTPLTLLFPACEGIYYEAEASNS